MRRTTLYHLTPAVNVPSILSEGLRASNDGAIYAFTDMIVADTIARNQVFARRYGVFRIIRRGIRGVVEPDDVAEFAAPYQRRIIQARIAPQHLRYLGTIDADTTARPTAWDYHVGEQIYEQSRLEVEEEFALRRQLMADLRASRLAPTSAPGAEVQDGK